MLYDYSTNLYIDNGVRPAVINYATGVHSKLHNPSGNSSVKLSIVVGVNSSDPLTREHGRNWGNMITTLNSWLADTGFNDHLIIKGGIEAETNWRSPSESHEWIQGYYETLCGRYDVVLGNTLTGLLCRF